MKKIGTIKKNNTTIKNAEIKEQSENSIIKESKKKSSNQIKEKQKNISQKDNKEKDTSKIKNKKKFIMIVTVIIAVFLLASGGIVTYYYVKENNKISEISKSQEETLKNFSEEIKYGQEFSYDNLIDNLIDTNKLKKNTNITILINDEKLSNKDTFKFEKIGTYTIKVKLEYTYIYSLITFLTKNIENEKILKIVVVDKEKPIIEGVSNKEITVGDNINLQDGITATDNVDGEVEVKIDGTVDNEKPGNYDIKVIATDKSGNTEEVTFTVTVKEKPKEPINNSYNNKNYNNGNNNNGSSVAVSREQHIADILRITNQYRAEVGANAVTLDSKLSELAQKRAMELVSLQSHTRPNGTYYHTIFEEYGMLIWVSGENLAYGQPDGISAAEWWRNSPGHYQTMTYKGYTKIGIGAYYSGGKWYWIQLFTSV